MPGLPFGLCVPWKADSPGDPCCGCPGLWNAACALAPGTPLFLTTVTGTYTLNDARGTACSTGSPLVWNSSSIAYPAASIKQSASAGPPASDSCSADTAALATAVLTIYPTAATVGACSTLVFTEKWLCCVTAFPWSAVTPGRQSPSSVPTQPPGFPNINIGCTNIVGTSSDTGFAVGGSSFLIDFTLPPSPTPPLSGNCGFGGVHVDCPSTGETLVNAGMATVST
jgi:hypothetical protein